MTETPRRYGGPVMGILRTIGRILVGVLVVAYAILDTVLFPLFRPLIGYLSGLRLFEALGALIQRLPPYLVLVILAVPFVVLEPLKVFALWWIAVGHIIQGGVLLIFAHILSILTLERLYHTGHSQLMQIGWFKRLMRWVTGLRDIALGWARASAAWRWGARLAADLRSWLRSVTNSAN